MSAIPQLSGAKRTCLLGKISSNLRPLTLERSLARKGRVPSFLSPPAHGPSPHFVAAGQVDRFRGKPDIKRHVGSAGPVAFDPYVWSGRAKQEDSTRRWQAVLHQCIRAFDWSVVLRAHHGYQRACVLITGQASMDHLGHQVSHAPGRPNLHLLFILSQTLAGKRATCECYTA
jgi:hypothetical protein